jgi:fatty acid desaturase
MAFSLAPRTQLVIACAAVVLAFYLGYGLRYLASLPAGPSWWHFPLAFVIGGGIGAAFVIGHFGNRLFRQESSEFAEIWAFVAACWAGLAAYAMFGGAA